MFSIGVKGEVVWLTRNVPADGGRPRIMQIDRAEADTMDAARYRRTRSLQLSIQGLITEFQALTLSRFEASTLFIVLGRLRGAPAFPISWLTHHCT